MNFSENFFDCAIITVLREEMKLFLERFKENILIKEKKQNYTTFYFCDKHNNVRNGIIYNVGNSMGNSEACRLMYEFTRKYKADIFINVGLAGGVNDVSIGDVVMISKCYSLSENNSTISKLQTTPLENYDSDYVESIFNNITDEFINSFKRTSKIGIENIENIINKKIKTKKERAIALSFFKEKNNNIHFGKCATVHSVVKDENTYNEICNIRKCNVLEMEAYYLALWHNIIKTNEQDKIGTNSKFIMLKSPSDNGIGNTKEILEKIGSRQLAMTNLSFVTKYLIEEVIEFNNNETKKIHEFINEKYSSKSIDDITKKHEDKKLFNDLCKYLIVDDKQDDYFEYAKNVLNEDGAILTIYGPAGTGKSTFFSYLYNELKKDNYCIYIDIAKIIKHDDMKSIDVCLYLIERMMQTDNQENIIILFDGFGKKLKAPSNFIIDTFSKISNIVSLKTNQKISFCVNDMYNSKIESKYLPEFFSTYSINFNNISIYDDKFEKFIESFFYYYKNIINIPADFIDVSIKILRNSEIQCIDFRLLKAIAENFVMFKNSNDFHKFIVTYSSKNGVTPNDLLTISDIMYDDYYRNNENKSFAMSKIQEKYITAYNTLSQNIYTNAYLLSINIWNMCASSNNKIDNYEFLISKNINSFLAYCIKTSNSVEVNKKVQNILAKIVRENINKSSSIQLMYIFSQKAIFRMFNNNTRKLFRTLVEEKAKKVFEENSNISYTDIIEQRTMSIIMNSCFNEGKYLEEYNSLMIKDINFYELNDYLNYNIAFHILYYSRENHLFSDIENTTINPKNLSIIYYACDAISMYLKKYIDEPNQLHIMNFITILYIYKNYLCLNNDLLKYKKDCKELIENLYNIYDSKKLCSNDLKKFYNACMDK